MAFIAFIAFMAFIASIPFVAFSAFSAFAMACLECETGKPSWTKHTSEIACAKRLQILMMMAMMMARTMRMLAIRTITYGWAKMATET